MEIHRLMAANCDWSALPTDIVVTVAGALHSLPDFHALRGVCRAWRLASAPCPAALASQPPLLLLARRRPSPPSAESFYDSSRRKLLRSLSWQIPFTKFLTYSHGHLLAAAADDRLFLYNVFSGATLPLPRLPEGDWYHFSYARMSAPPSKPGNLIVLFSTPIPSRHILFCRTGDAQWLSGPRGSLVHDVLFFSGELYGLVRINQQMWLAKIELLDNPRITLLGAGLPYSKSFRSARWSLAEAGEKLLLLCYCSCDPVLAGYHYRTWQWEFSDGEWTPTRSLGGRAVFLADGEFVGSIAPVAGLGLDGNCIYTQGWRYYLDKKNYPWRWQLDGMPQSRVEGSIWVLPSSC